MLKAVLDANIVVSAFLVNGTEREVVEGCFSGKFQLVLSLDILDEFREVLLRPKFVFSQEEVDSFIDALVEASFVVQQLEKLSVCRDSDDNKFLEAAVEGGVAFIVSGGRDLLVLNKFRNINIMAAQKFMAQMK